MFARVLIFPSSRILKTYIYVTQISIKTVSNKKVYTDLYDRGWIRRKKETGGSHDAITIIACDHIDQNDSGLKNRSYHLRCKRDIQITQHDIEDMI